MHCVKHRELCILAVPDYMIVHMYADIFAGTNLREATIGSIPT